MNPIAAIRRLAPGLALVLVVALVAGALGVRLGLGSWLLALGAGLLLGGAAAAARTVWSRGKEEPSARNKKHGKTAPKGPAAPAPYDLANDQSTDNQRYLM